MRLEGRLQLKQTTLNEAAQTSGGIFLKQNTENTLAKVALKWTTKKNQQPERCKTTNAWFRM